MKKKVTYKASTHNIAKIAKSLKRQGVKYRLTKTQLTYETANPFGK